MMYKILHIPSAKYIEYIEYYPEYDVADCLLSNITLIGGVICVKSDILKSKIQCVSVIKSSKYVLVNELNGLVALTSVNIWTDDTSEYKISCIESFEISGHSDNVFIRLYEFTIDAVTKLWRKYV